MISAEEFCQSFKDRNITFFSGVPCSLLKHVLAYIASDPEINYIPAPREDAALGIASGAYMCGRNSGILIQNSGFGNIINCLTSFNLIHEIPVLIVISWRGYLGKDAPEHIVMGHRTLGLLKELLIPYETLENHNLENVMDSLCSSMRNRKIPGALVIRDGVLE